jgi:hypothetical protein
MLSPKLWDTSVRSFRDTGLWHEVREGILPGRGNWGLWKASRSLFLDLLLVLSVCSVWFVKIQSHTLRISECFDVWNILM